MKKSFGLTIAFRILFLALLLGGILLFAFTSNDWFLRVGVTGAVLALLLWWIFLGACSVFQKIRDKQYLLATVATFGRGGIALLIVYFLSILLSDMFDLRIGASVPATKDSKLVLLGASLIGSAIVVGIGLAQRAKRSKL